MALVDDMYEQALTAEYSVDIREHLSTLKEYAAKCETVTELGVRWVVSTWALLAGRPKALRSFDIVHISSYGKSEEEIKKAAADINVSFSFYNENVLITENIIETDLLFIDTLHSYKQLKMELKIHADKVKKYLIFHDVVTFGEADEAVVAESHDWPENLKEYFRSLPEGHGINKAIVELLTEDRSWRAERLFSNNNGLLILSRLPNA
jgi:hypothetical protein